MRKNLRFAVLAAALSLLCIPASSQAAGIGINVPGGAAAINMVGQAAATGASTGRVFLIYPGGSTPDAGTIANYQAVVTSFNASGVKPVIVVTGQGAPADVNAYASYVGTLARIYGNSVAAWEIWNEEDSTTWWGNDGGDPAKYAALLQATYPKVHPYAPVFVGGLTGNNYDFLDQVYSSLGGSSANAFDGVAVHTDTACNLVSPDSYFRDANGRIDRYSFLGLREVHQTMASHGDDNKPIWITELGWTTQPGTCSVGMFAGQKNAGVSEADQAKYLEMAWHCLKDYPYVTNALWFDLQDQGGSDYGLQRSDGSAKASRQAFATIVSGADPFAGQPCGDFSGPTLTVSQPTNGAMFTDVLPVRASATDPAGVPRITLFIDGKKIENSTTGGPLGTRNYSRDVQQTKHLPNGTHTVTLVAIDPSGNQSTVNVTVTKVDPSQLGALTTRFTPLLVAGHGSKRTVRTRVLAPVTGAIKFRAVHKIKLIFQKRKHGHWKTAHKYTKTAKAPLKLTVKLEKAQWRVQAVFPAKAPFKGSKTPWKYFKV